MNFYTYLAKKYAVANDADDSDVPIENCRAHGGPANCSVHRPELKNEIAKTDELDGDADTEAMDAAYADAVKRGDRDAALNMVREAAARAMPNTKVAGEDGLPKVVYHATNREFTVFHTPSYFAETKEAVDGIKGSSLTGRIVPVFINMEAPYSLDAEGAKWSRIYVPEDGHMSLNAIVEMERQNGWKEYRSDDTIVDVDGMIVNNVREGDLGTYLTTDYIPKAPSQIKSADITYDDAGNLIPLSKRFQNDNPDIRF